MTPNDLKDRFRIDVDDVAPHPEDTSGCLWSDADIFSYMDEAHAEFVERTLYLYDVLEVPFEAACDSIALPRRIIEVRGPVYLKNEGTLLQDINAEQRVWASDYGTMVSSSPFGADSSGRPNAYSLDIVRGQIKLSPTPLEADMLLIPAFLEARPIVDGNSRFELNNTRHIRALLNGMKRLAYMKQDADVYDPEQALRWGALFERDIERVHGEILRQRRTPGETRYGGL